MLDFDISGETFWVLEGTRYPLQECLVVLDGEVILPSQDHDDPMGMLSSAKTIEIEVGSGKRFKLPKRSEIDSGSYDMLLEMIYPT